MRKPGSSRRLTAPSLADLGAATLAAGGAAAGAAAAQEPRRPLDLATFPRTSLQIWARNSHYVAE
jgi:hypothetical protein